MYKLCFWWIFISLFFYTFLIPYPRTDMIWYLIIKYKLIRVKLIEVEAGNKGSQLIESLQCHSFIETVPSKQIARWRMNFAMNTMERESACLAQKIFAMNRAQNNIYQLSLSMEFIGEWLSTLLLFMPPSFRYSFSCIFDGNKFSV